MGKWMLLGGVALLAAVLILVARSSRRGRQIATYTLLVLLGLVMVLPFYEMFVLSTHSTSRIYMFPPPFWFGGNLAANFSSMLASVNLPRSFLNSCIVSGCYTVLVLLFCSMGGYAFAVYRFPGRNLLFSGLLITMMIPWTAGIIPWFFMMSSFGWVDNFLALILPNCANAFGIFWMRQYCQNNVPIALTEAAKLDGCSEWLIFFRIIVPILKPAFAALGIMQFVNTWNDFMQPLLILRSSSMQTLPLMLKYMLGDPTRGTDMGAMMLASSCAVLPLLIVFLSSSKLFMSGLTSGAVKE